MSTPSPHTAGNARVISAAIALVALVGVGLSLLNPLLSVAMERQGVSAFASGLTASAAGFGTIAVVAFMAPLTRGLGVAGLLGLAIALSTLATVLFPLTSGLIVWTLLRFVMGGALGVIFTLSEFWINVAAPPARRGLVMGLYATTLYAGFALGPLLLGSMISGVESGTPLMPFLVTAGLMACGLAPLALVWRSAPVLEESGPASPARFVRAAPAAMLGALVFGVVETGAILLLPVHALRLGYETGAAAYLVAAFTLGNVLLQIPIGLISDKVARLPLLATLALLSALAMVALALATQPLPTAVLLFLAGGISGGIYPVALALLGERFTGSALAAANGAVVSLYSLGLIVGPPGVGLVMDMAGAAGLPLALGGVLALYGAAIVLWYKKARGVP